MVHSDHPRKFIDGSVARCLLFYPFTISGSAHSLGPVWIPTRSLLVAHQVPSEFPLGPVWFPTRSAPDSLYIRTFWFSVEVFAHSEFSSFSLRTVKDLPNLNRPYLSPIPVMKY